MGKPTPAPWCAIQRKAALRLRDMGGQVEIVAGDVTRPESLASAMRDVTAVVHYVAIAMEKGGQTYDEVNFQGHGQCRERGGSGWASGASST